jgi:hypothetical protein
LRDVGKRFGVKGRAWLRGLELPLEADVEGEAHGTPTATGGIAAVWTSDVTCLILRFAPGDL